MYSKKCSSKNGKKYVFNKATQRCVLADGVTGKKIIKAKLEEKQRKINTGLIKVNPLTNRLINVTGRTYKQAVKKVKYIRKDLEKEIERMKKTEPTPLYSLPVMKEAIKKDLKQLFKDFQQKKPVALTDMPEIKKIIKHDVKQYISKKLKYPFKNGGSVTLKRDKMLSLYGNNATIEEMMRNYKILIKDIVDNVDFKKFRAIMVVGGQYYTINERNYVKLLNTMVKSESYEKYVGTALIGGAGFSDEQTVMYITTETELEIKIIKRHGKEDKYSTQNNSALKTYNRGHYKPVTKKNFTKRIFTRKGGKFFAYLNKTVFDLSRYGIFKTLDDNNYVDNCLINALRAGGMNDEVLLKCKTLLLNREVKTKDLNKLCDKLNICIKLRHETNSHATPIYGDKKNKIYNIGLLDEHYFIYEPCNITLFAVRNYEKIKNNCKDVSEYHKIRSFAKRRNGLGFNKTATEFSNSYEIIKALLENKDTCLEKIKLSNSILLKKYSNRVDVVDELNCDKSDTKSINNDLSKYGTIKALGDYPDTYIIDIETYNHKQNKIEKATNKNKIFYKATPYLMRVKNFHTGEKKIFYGEDCPRKFLNTLTKNTRLISHNTDFDSRFFIKYMLSPRENIRNNTTIYADGVIKRDNKILNIKYMCSYRMIPMKLAKVAEIYCHKTETIKEIMPYAIYTEENIKKRIISINDAKKVLNKNDHAQFVRNIVKWNIGFDGNRYDCIAYADKYCEIDCDILHEAYNNYRNKVLKMTNNKMDILSINTISSLADKFLIMKNCYTDCYELSGIAQQWLSRFVVGGRTITQNNKMIRVDKEIIPLDGNALYASAMNRLPGFAKGVPKVLTTTNKEKVSKYDYYYVEVVIKSIGKKRNMPLISLKNAEGGRNWTNNVIGKTLYLDKIQLEDAIKFHDIDYEIIRGFYQDEGFTTNIKEVSEFLFNERNKNKNTAEGDVYKQIMCSAYGRDLISACDHSYKYKDKQNFDRFLDQNYNDIECYVDLEDCEHVRVKMSESVLEHFNRVHIGIQILSMSKRIMNEVICLAEDLGINVYYEDTDSIHIERSKLDLLINEYRKIYNRELIGNGIGQFKNDIKMKDKTLKNTYVKKAIYLGKKAYVHILAGTDINGNEVIETSCRLKGISPESIIKEANKNKSSIYSVYERLYNGEAIKFDLLCIDDNGNVTLSKFRKEMNKDLIARESYEREISF